MGLPDGTGAESSIGALPAPSLSCRSRRFQHELTSSPLFDILSGTRLVKRHAFLEARIFQYVLSTDAQQLDQ
jgi:hypothetical protein